MRLLVLSDLHIEFGALDIAPRKDLDVVVLAGDIDIGTRGFAWARRTFECRIVYVLGNHEFYGQNYDELRERAAISAEVAGIDLLENGAVVAINDVAFIGGTLWTDFMLHGHLRFEQDVLESKERLNDFRRIGGFSPEDSIRAFTNTRAAIESSLAARRGQRRVVVTHHAPSPKSVAQRFRGDPLSAAFASNLEDMILREAPDLWIHGHVHDSFDYVIGKTRIVCNPRGYFDREMNSEFNPNVPWMWTAIIR